MVVTAFSAWSATHAVEADPAGPGPGALAHEIMSSPVITVAPATSLRAVADVLIGNRISAAPIVNAGGRLIGIVSKADLLASRMVTGSAGPAARAARGGAGVVRRRAARTAAELMSSPVLCIHPSTPVAQVARIMRDRGYKRLPVLAHGRLVGIVSRGDVLRAVTLEGQRRRRRAVASPAAGP